jgi:hypothetical protein
VILSREFYQPARREGSSSVLLRHYAPRTRDLQRVELGLAQWRIPPTRDGLIEPETYMASDGTVT